jgi:hypothetical protein
MVKCLFYFLFLSFDQNVNMSNFSAIVYFCIGLTN